jgi:hypothetical protein
MVIYIYLNGTVLEKVDHSTYLSSKLSNIGDSTADINYRISLSASTLKK